MAVAVDLAQVLAPVLPAPVYWRVPARHPPRQHGEPGQHGRPGGPAHVRGLGYQPLLDTGVRGAVLHVAVGTLLDKSIDNCFCLLYKWNIFSLFLRPFCKTTKLVLEGLVLSLNSEPLLKLDKSSCA